MSTTKLPPLPEMPLRAFNVWDVTSPSSGETARIVRVAYPGDESFQHEYQRIAWSGLAHTKDEALALSREARR